jgi:phosphoribosyl-dephospho-CoA transferase
MELSRHQLVWLASSEADMLRFANEADRPAAEAWLRDNPAVVRRCEIDFGWGVALGIPLPSRLDRRRIALFAPAGSIIRSEPMPLLRDALATAPAEWQPTLDAANDLLNRSCAAVRVYGSLGWQHITGETYLRPQSDVDLLIEPEAAFDIVTAIDAFRELAASTAPRLDGELLIARDEAAAWREFETPTPDIMLRSRTGLALESKASIMNRVSRAVT